MLGVRLQQAMRISAKRWLYYHDNNNYPFFKSIGIPLGMYKKAKGCECRACSAQKHHLKHELHKKLRNEN